LKQVLWLLQNEPFDKALVFCNTRERAEELGAYVIGQSVRAGVLHGEMDHRERKRIMGLLQRGEIRVLIATDLAARGLDVSGMDLVINFDLPRSGDDYLHRSGRTGRAGERGLAVTLVLGPEFNRMESIERYLRMRFQRAAIKGLEARFQGPAKGRGKPKAGARTTKKKVASKPKVRERDRKNIGKRRKPSGEGGVDAGFNPPKRRKPQTDPS
jgi:ATP-dependent RNA helicase SrmB